MDFITYQRRLNYLEELIIKGRLSSPSQIAPQWNCSERTIRRMINTLRDNGSIISYNKTKMRYEVEGS